MQSDRYLGDDTASTLTVESDVKTSSGESEKKGREAVEASMREKCFSQKKGD